MFKFILGIVIGGFLFWYCCDKYEEYQNIKSENTILTTRWIEACDEFSKVTVDNLRLKACLIELMEKVDDTTQWNLLQRYFPSAFPPAQDQDSIIYYNGKGAIWYKNTFKRKQVPTI